MHRNIYKENLLISFCSEKAHFGSFLKGALEYWNSGVLKMPIDQHITPSLRSGFDFVNPEQKLIN